MRVDSLADIKLKAMTQRLKEMYRSVESDLDEIIEKYENGWDEDGIHHNGLLERIAVEYDKFERGLYDPERLIGEARKAGVTLENMWYWKKYQSGELTAKDFFDRWYVTQINREQFWKDFRAEMAQRVTNANLEAVAYINGQTPRFYARASNEVAEIVKKSAMEKGVTGIRFDMVNEYKVKAILKQGGKLPYKKLNINIPKDVKFYESKVQTILLRGVVGGKSKEEIAKDFAQALHVGQSGALRMAKFAITNAIETGKQDRAEHLASMGAYTAKYWVNVGDDRVRHAHVEAGNRYTEKSPIFWDSPFIVGGEELMYPGDPNGSPWNIENCRCRREICDIFFASNLTPEQKTKAGIKILNPKRVKPKYDDAELYPIFDKKV